jgi:hypothetical protein
MISCWLRCANNLINRKLYHVDISTRVSSQHVLDDLIKAAIKKYHITEKEAHYFVFTDTIRNNAIPGRRWEYPHINEGWDY